MRRSRQCDGPFVWTLAKNFTIADIGVVVPLPRKTITEETWCKLYFFDLIKTMSFFADVMFFELTSLVMEINSLQGTLSTIPDVVLFCGTAFDVRSCFFFPHNIPFPTSVVLLTRHCTLLTARGRRVFFVSVLCVSSMASNAVDTM